MDCMAFIAALRVFLNVLNYREIKFWIALLSHMLYVFLA